MIGSTSASTSAANPALAWLLSQIGSQSPITDASDSDGFDANVTASAASPTSAAQTITPISPQLSSAILATLINMQAAQSGGTTTSSPTTTTENPVQQLFSAMDTNGDGSISQGEMESYIEGVGGTQTEADALYTSLAQGSSTGISEAQMQSALDGPQQAMGGGMHHHHHHHAQGAGDGDSASSAADVLLQAVDAGNTTNTTNASTNTSTSTSAITESELTNFFTQNGGTSQQASTDFATLANGSSTLTTADLTNAWPNLQNQGSSGVTMSLFNMLAQANTVSETGTVASVTT